MEAITMRELKRKMVGDTLSDKLPLKITNYGETIAVILTVKQYNRLVRQAKSNGLHDVRQAKQGDMQSTLSDSLHNFYSATQKEGKMPFKDKNKEREYRRGQKQRQRMSHPSASMSHPVQPNVSPDVSPAIPKMSHPVSPDKPSFHCEPGLGDKCGHCTEALFCPLGGYQYWFKRTYGRYDTYNADRLPVPA